MDKKKAVVRIIALVMAALLLVGTFAAVLPMLL